MNKRPLILMVIIILVVAGCAWKLDASEKSTAERPTQLATPVSKITIYAPASTSSIPVILAVKKIEGANLTLFTNHAQANALFLRGDVDLLITGISVGVDMRSKEAPVQLVNSYVSGLSYLLTYDRKVNQWVDLKGQAIYLPFQGSPLEEVTAHLVKAEGLEWPGDFQPVYSPFESSIELLKQGKASAVALPEPYVSLLENQPHIFISISYFDAWQKIHPEDHGYPQVGTLVKADWAQSHPDEITQFNEALVEAVKLVESDPAGALDAVRGYYSLPEDVLSRSLKRTQYSFVSGEALKDVVTRYYAQVEKPLHEDSFFYYTSGQ
uniref:ABC transporter substrate-binding protein n=1 Tax=Anaerolinea thermolimosa TaxID=229919 RepID=A0A7C4KIC5_9CHLR